MRQETSSASGRRSRSNSSSRREQDTIMFRSLSGHGRTQHIEDLEAGHVVDKNDSVIGKFESDGRVASASNICVSSSTRPCHAVCPLA